MKRLLLIGIVFAGLSNAALAQEAETPMPEAPPAPVAMPTAPAQAGGSVIVFEPSPSAPPPAATGETYPLCSKTVTDRCKNPREAGKNYGNVPLDYWPGKPASELSAAEKSAAQRPMKKPKSK
jgi:hypothetical protein